MHTLLVIHTHTHAHKCVCMHARRNTHYKRVKEGSFLSCPFLPVAMGPLVEVLLLSALEVQLLVGPSSQLSVLTHIVQVPHIQPLVQLCSPSNGGVITHNIISVKLCTFLFCCSFQLIGGSTPLLGFMLSLVDHFISRQCPSAQHYSNNDPSSETQYCQE